MAYDRSSLVTSIRNRAKDPSFSEDLIVEYIQSIQDEVLGRHLLSVAELSTSETISSGATETDLPTTFQALVDISLVPASTPNQAIKPTYVPYRKFFDSWPNRLVSPAIVPLYFSIFGGQLLWPSALNENYTLKLRFIQKSTELSSGGSVPLIPSEYKEILIRGGLAGVEEYRENDDKAAVLMRRVESLTEDLVRRYSVRQYISLPKGGLVKPKAEGPFDDGQE